MGEETIFDKIIRKEVPANIVHEDEVILAFEDIQPQAPVHILVIPKIKVKSFADLKGLDDLDVGRFIKGVSQVAAEVGLEEGGYRVVFNTGRHGQQSVDYIHAHILGGRQMTWPAG